ncbi:hypothetical protein L1987_60242 [Smallanthus sonchifolius]|uniref:Uncharacterized protein n=1 Tax=Smallanthus sonchifolius TaxID=185202 RepID=A0ACB9D8D4_9ASTR|nr:hypothetical protein L1987_60242 [Smallanthus sonchifolius]
MTVTISYSHHQFLSFSGIPRKRLMDTTLIRCSTSPVSNPVLRPELLIRVGTQLIPHPKKVDKGGEDAFFVSSYNGGVIAVADGVSGWAEKDVDPAQFSRELMRKASSLVDDDEVNYDPRILVRKAHAATSSTGSATVIVSMLDNNGILKVANVGDCGLRVIRKGKTRFFSTHLDATVTSIDSMKGDIIVMGSDGLFHNVFDHEIVSTIAEHKDVVQKAKALANLAYKHSVDFYFDSPYSIEARNRGLDVPWWKKALGQKLTGGKMDDITVIVGEVVSN